jgi:plasmid rolling circle replication initiator protein Rep
MDNDVTEIKQKLDSKDEKWNKKKAENTAAAKALAAAEFDNPNRDTLQKWSNRLEECSAWLLFAEYQNLSTAELRRKLKNASFCRVRGCPLCAWRQSMSNFARALQKLPQIQEQNPSYEFLFLTLTVKNCSVYDLREQIQHMSKSWRRLTQRKEFKVVKGFIRTTEITRNSKTGSAHPHFHCILVVPPSYFSSKYYIKQQRWIELWRKCAKLDYDPSVDIRRIKKTDLKKGLVETLKYAVKGGVASSDPAFFREMLVQIQRLHLIATGGILKGIFSEDVTEKEMLNTGLEEETEEAEGPNRITDENGDVWEEIEEILFSWKNGEYVA